MASTECAFIGRGGEVYDENRVFSAHGIGFRMKSFFPEPPPREPPKHFPAIAHHIYSTYPTATGHFFNQVARLFWLLMTLPEDVPILIPRSHPISSPAPQPTIRIPVTLPWFEALCLLNLGPYRCTFSYSVLASRTNCRISLSVLGPCRKISFCRSKPKAEVNRRA